MLLFNVILADFTYSVTHGETKTSKRRSFISQEKLGFSTACSDLADSKRPLSGRSKESV